MKKVNIKYVLSHQFMDEEFLRYDMLIRYMYVCEYFNGHDFTLYKKFYGRHAKDRVKRFAKLIKSFEEKGYDERYPIVLTDKHKYMVGSTHRVALCIWFNIKKIPTIYQKEKKKRYYGRERMEELGFTDEELNMLESTRKEIFCKFNM